MAREKAVEWNVYRSGLAIDRWGGDKEMLHPKYSSVLLYDSIQIQINDSYMLFQLLYTLFCFVLLHFELQSLP